MTQCTADAIICNHLGRRDVVADFSGGRLTSDGGALLLAKLDQQIDLLHSFSMLFTDHRDRDLIEHPVLDLIRQRVYALALGYEDLNDHDDLSLDPLLATVVGKREPAGAGRRRHRDRGRPLAGKSTLNRLELTSSTTAATDRYKKIELDEDRARRFFAEHFVATCDEDPEVLVLDFDATDDPLYGRQEGRFFQGYYKEYVYLPLYVFCGHHLLLAMLRPGDADAPAGTVDALTWLVPLLRRRWPTVRLIVRGDSGFARDEIMTWCEDHDVEYVFGLGKNSVLETELEAAMALARTRWTRCKRRVRVYRDFTYRTRTTWARTRRVIGKAEHNEQGANPRFVVTSVKGRGCRGYGGRRLYEQLYCGRGDMENRIKEQQLYLYADRTSSGQFRANEIRLWLSSLAYVLLNALRRQALAQTDLASARCDTIRLKLLKIGAAVRVTARRVWVMLSSSYPLKALFRQIWDRLEQLAPRPLWTPQRC